MVFTTNRGFKRSRSSRKSTAGKSQKAEEIKRVAGRLVADKGYNAMSMREIGRAIGMNQASLYYYFNGKEDILFEIMNAAMDEALAALQDICAADIPSEEKLSRVLGLYARDHAGDESNFTMPADGMQSLGERHYLILLGKRKQYMLMIRSILEGLAEENRLKEIDPTVASYAFFGMIHYGIKWYHRDVPVVPDDLANGFVDVFTKGVLKES